MKSYFILSNYNYSNECKIGFKREFTECDIITVNTRIEIYKELYIVHNTIINSECIKLSGIITDRYVVLGQNCIMHYIITLDENSVNEITELINKYERYIPKDTSLF